MRIIKIKNKKINLLKKIKNQIQMRILKKLLPYLIGFIGGVITAKSEKGSELLNKIPFLGTKAV